MVPSSTVMEKLLRTGLAYKKILRLLAINYPTIPIISYFWEAFKFYYRSRVGFHCVFHCDGLIDMTCGFGVVHNHIRRRDCRDAVSLQLGHVQVLRTRIETRVIIPERLIIIHVLMQAYVCKCVNIIVYRF